MKGAARFPLHGEILRKITIQFVLLRWFVLIALLSKNAKETFVGWQADGYNCAVSAIFACFSLRYNPQNAKKLPTRLLRGRQNY